jgi:PadR family transcriptional regulator PadR
VARIETQLKRGLLDVCVLAALQKEESYGYQIIKDISPYIKISESTLYPILRRLEDADLIKVRKTEYNGRIRKYYRLTPKGKKRILEFEEDWKEILAVYKFIRKESPHP